MKATAVYSGVRIVLATATMATAIGMGPSHADESGWPREISTSEATVTMHQPQLESFEGDDLSARAAVSVQTPSIGEFVFGGVWIEARVATDRSERTVELLDVKVTAARPGQPVQRPSTPSTRPATPGTRPTTPSQLPSNLNQQLGARERGAQRTQQYQRSVSPQPSRGAVQPPRPAGGARPAPRGGAMNRGGVRR